MKLVKVLQEFALLNSPNAHELHHVPFGPGGRWRLQGSCSSQRNEIRLDVGGYFDFDRPVLTVDARTPTQFVRFMKPISNGCLHLISVSDVNDVHELGFRRPVDPSHLRSFQGPAEEHLHIKEALLRTHEEVAGLAREHDRLVRGVNPLMSEGNGGLAQPLPSIPKILRELLG